MNKLADMLSFLRILLTPVILLLAYLGEWRWAFAVLIAAWATDLFDGLAAKRFGSRRDAQPDFDADGIADSVLAFGTALVPVVYVVAHSGWFANTAIITLYALTVVSGIAMVQVMNREPTKSVRRIITFNMVVMHGLLQIVAVIIWFTYMAFGNGSMMGAVLGAMVALVFLQARKISLWFQGRLA